VCLLLLALTVLPSAAYAKLSYLGATIEARNQGAAAVPNIAGSTAPAIELVGSFGGSFSTIAISGTLAYVGEGASLAVLDVGNPTQVVRLTRIALPGVSNIQIAGNRMYVIGGDQLSILDVSAPSSPALLGSCGLPRHPTALQVVGSDAYITYSFHPFPMTESQDKSSGLVIIDVGDPAHPIQRSSYTPLPDALGVAVANGFAYVADRNGVDIIRVPQGGQPTLRGNYPLPSGYNSAAAIQVAGSLAYVVYTAFKLPWPWPELHILDISDPANPKQRGTLTILDNYFVNFQVVGGLAYVSHFNADKIFQEFGVTIIDVSAPDSPKIGGTYSTAGQAHVAVEQNRVYLLSSGKIQILDRQSTNDLTLRGSYTADYPSVSALRVSETTAYLVESNRLRLLDVSDPSHPSLLSSAPTAINVSGNNDMRVAGQFVYLGTDSLNIFDVSNPISPTLRSSYPISITTALYVTGNMAYLVGDHQLTILDVSDPAVPTLRGAYGGFAYGYDIQVEGNLAYVAADYKLQILDVSNPISPTLRGTYSHFNDVITDVNIQGTFAYVVEGSGLSIVDISNPTAPALRGRYGTIGAANDIRANGNFAYVASSDYTAMGLSGVQVLDVSNPASVLLRGSFTALSSYPELQIVGDLIYVNAKSGGMEIWRMHPERLPSPAFLPSLL
jgi:hypothetical protein